MLPSRVPGETRRQQAESLLERRDDYGLALLLILLTVFAFAAATGPATRFLSVALSGCTLLFVLHTSGAHRRTVRAVAVVVVLGVAGSAVGLFAAGSWGTSMAEAIGLLLAILAPGVILLRIVRSPVITFRLVLGALSIYLLIGLAYAYFFPLLADLQGTAFFVQTSTPNQSDYLYFSYVTLATVGYGDFTAATALTRMVAVSEGLIGQLYLVSAVALLVGNIGRNIRDRPASPGPAAGPDDPPSQDRPA
ncbi:MAG TPA: potassium channel family protein [Candidatus Dormibacteraeota bacterium]|nr:potassium channel family protein [Candidatus Dormibacteraeota bacterium]